MVDILQTFSLDVRRLQDVRLLLGCVIDILQEGGGGGYSCYADHYSLRVTSKRHRCRCESLARWADVPSQTESNQEAGVCGKAPLVSVLSLI